jgi:hypothetical protein
MTFLLSQVTAIFRIERLRLEDAGVESFPMGEAKIVVPAAIAAFALIAGWIKTRHRRRMRRLASIRKVLDTEAVSAQ